MSLNTVVLEGRFVRDPDLRSTKHGTSVLNFTIAANFFFKDKEGKTVSETYFASCEAWDKGAELIAKHFKKGRPIIIEGRLKNNDWEDENGVLHRQDRIRVEKFHFPLSDSNNNVSHKTEESEDLEPVDDDKIPF